MPTWNSTFYASIRPGGTTSVELFGDGQPLGVGHGDGRDDALWDPWTTLVHRQEAHAAEYVAEKIRA